LTYLGFLLREKLAAMLIIPSSWGSQLAEHFNHQLGRIKLFLALLPGRKRRLLQGEFRTHILYFILIFALLYFYLHHFIKNTKNSFFIVVTLLLLVHHVVP
jgi:hypothetical protein